MSRFIHFSCSFSQLYKTFGIKRNLHVFKCILMQLNVIILYIIIKYKRRPPKATRKMIYSGIKYVKCKMRDSRSTGRVQKKTEHWFNEHTIVWKFNLLLSSSSVPVQNTKYNINWFFIQPQCLNTADCHISLRCFFALSRARSIWLELWI